MDHFFSKSIITLRSNVDKELYPNNNIYNFSNQLCDNLSFSNKTKVALCEIHLPLNFRFILEQSKYREIFVLSDIVEESIVGSLRLNILKVITINNDKFPTNCQVELFSNLLFYDLKFSELNSINFQITDSWGSALRTDNETKFDETFIVLKFK